MQEKNTSGKVFRALIENNDRIISLVDDKLNIRFQNSSIKRIPGAPKEQYQKISVDKYLHPKDKEKFENIITKALANPGNSIPAEIRLKNKNGNYTWVEGMVTNQLAEDDIHTIVMDLKDVSKEKEAEQKILKIKRLYHFISKINQMIVKVANEETLFREACNIAVKHAEFGMAWIGIINKKTKILEPVMHEGMDLLSFPFEN